jgi:hypothetical protein
VVNHSAVTFYQPKGQSMGIAVHSKDKAAILLGSPERALGRDILSITSHLPFKDYIDGIASREPMVCPLSVSEFFLAINVIKEPNSSREAIYCANELLKTYGQPVKARAVDWKGYTRVWNSFASAAFAD